jgi:hypothetical protein
MFNESGPVDMIAARDLRQRAQAESHAICGTLCERLRSGSLPPDEAYWWTRIAVSDLLARLDEPCDIDDADVPARHAIIPK